MISPSPWSAAASCHTQPRMAGLRSQAPVPRSLEASPPRSSHRWRRRWRTGPEAPPAGRQTRSGAMPARSTLRLRRVRAHAHTSRVVGTPGIEAVQVRKPHLHHRGDRQSRCTHEMPCAESDRRRKWATRMESPPLSVRYCIATTIARLASRPLHGWSPMSGHYARCVWQHAQTTRPEGWRGQNAGP